MKKIFAFLFFLIIIIHLILVYNISHYLFSSTGDMFNYAFDQTWFKGMVHNYNKSNGRWAQGITNDYWFYQNKIIIIPLLNIVFVFATFWVSKRFLDNYLSIIITASIYIVAGVCVYSYYYLFYYLPVANSYTIGFSLSLILYSILFILINKKIKYNKIAFGIAAAICIFTSGLVEIVSISIIYILGAVMFYFLFFYKKINKPILYLFLISVIGFMFLFFSPGNIRRREIASENQSFNVFTIDYSLLFEQSYNLLIRDHITLILLLLFIIYLAIRGNSFNKRFTVSQKFYITLVCPGFAFLPMIIGFLASNGTIGIAKSFIFFIIHLIFSTYFLVFSLINKSSTLSKVKHIKVVDAFLFAIVLMYVVGLANKKNNIGNTIKGFSENYYKDLYIEEKARRHYLIYKNEEKSKQTIPAFTKKPRNLVINYRNYKNELMPKTYSRIFNNKQPVFSKSADYSPNLLLSAFLVNENITKPLKKLTATSNIYFLKPYNTILISNYYANVPIKIKSTYKTPFLTTKTKYFVGKTTDLVIKEDAFINLKNDITLLGLDIPSNTYQVDIFLDGNKKPITLKKGSFIDFNKINDFKKEHVFSIMN